MAQDKSAYKSNKYTFPSAAIDPDLKDASWYKRNAEALYSLDANDLSGITSAQKKDFTTNRLYAKGMQSAVKYMDQLCPLKEDSTERSGYMNISWDIVPILPKYRKAVLGKFQKIEYDIQCSAIDELSMSEKEEKKWIAWAKKQIDLSEVDKLSGAQDNLDEQIVKSLSSVEELNMYTEIGGFKMTEEVAIEKIIEETFTISSWPDIKNSIFEDLFDLGVAFSMDYYCPIEGKVKTKYLDAMCVIVRYSKEKDFKNISSWGVLETMTIADLRISEPNFTEDDLYDIARACCGSHNNPVNIQSGLIDNNNPGYGYKYDAMMVEYLYCEWDGVNTKKFQKKKDKFGKEVVYDAKYNYAPTNPDIEVLSTDIKTIHKCNWIIGTKHIFDWGILKDIPRESKKEAAKSLRGYKLSDRSIVADTIPLCDAIQLNWLKFQNDIAMSVPAGVAVDIDALGNIVVGGETLNPLEVLDIRRQTGDLLFSSKDQLGTETGSRPSPVTPTNGGMGTILTERIATMHFYVEQLEEVTGINKIAAASTPHPDQAVGVAKLSIGATDNVLQPLYYGYVNIKQSIAKHAMLRIQYLASINKLDSYLPAISKSDTEILTQGAHISTRKMGIKMEMRPTDEMKSAIRQQLANLALKPLEQGGLSSGDILMVEYLLENSTIKIAMFYLAFKEKQNKMQAQTALQGSAQRDAEALQQKTQAETQALQMKVKIETDARILIDNNLASHKMKEIELQGQIDLNIKKEEGQISSLHTGAKISAEKEISDNKINADLEKHHTSNVKDLMLADPQTEPSGPPNPYQTMPQPQ